MSRALSRWDVVAALFCAAVAAGLALRPFSDVDYHWHLTVGRYVAEHGFPPTINAWSFTAPSHPYPPTAWLFGFVIHHLWTRGGDAWVHLFVACLAGLTFAVTCLTARLAGAKLHWAVSLTVCAALMSEFRFVPRPHIVSYFFLSLTLLGLLKIGQGTKWPVVGLPLLLALWSNFHAGAVFGAGLLGIFGAWVLYLRVRRLPAPLTVWETLALGVACLLALLANPSGLELSLYGAHHLQNVYSVVLLSEFMTPSWARFKPFWLFSGLYLLWAGWEFFRRPEQRLQAWWVSAFAVLAFRAVRVIPKFFLVSTPWAARWVSALEPVRFQKLFLLLSLFAPALVISVSDKPWAFWFRPLQLGVEPTAHPVAMASWVKAHGISGRCFASWDVSGFVEHRLPDSPVYLDPRLSAYPASVFHDIEQADDSQEKFDALMQRYEVEWAFRGNSRLRLSGIGRFRPDRWAVVYWDETGQVQLRRDIARFADLIAREEFVFFRPGRDLLESFRTLQGHDRLRWKEEMQRLRRQAPREVSAHMGLCLEWARDNQFALATQACEDAHTILKQREKAWPGSTAHNARVLAAAYLHLHDMQKRHSDFDAASKAFQQGLFWLQEAIRQNPEDEKLKITLKQLLNPALRPP